MHVTGGHADAPPALTRAIREAVADALEQRADGDRLRADGQATVAGAGDHEQVLGELGEMVALLDRGHERGPHLGRVIARAQRALELGLEYGDRRAQLVARVGDEAPLALERAAQPVEHVVERLAQPPDLVAGGREREPLVARRERHLGGAGAHRVDGTERRAGQHVAEQRSDEDGQRAADRERGDQAAEDVVAVVGRQHLLAELVPDLDVHEHAGAGRARAASRPRRPG